MPVDVLEIAPRVVSVTFEPGVNATRFCLITESPTTAGRYTIAFYSFGDKGITHLFSLEDKALNGACVWGLQWGGARRAAVRGGSVNASGTEVWAVGWGEWSRVLMCEGRRGTAL